MRSSHAAIAAVSAPSSCWTKKLANVAVNAPMTPMEQHHKVAMTRPSSSSARCGRSRPSSRSRCPPHAIAEQLDARVLAALDREDAEAADADGHDGEKR